MNYTYVVKIDRTPEPEEGQTRYPSPETIFSVTVGVSESVNVRQAIMTALLQAL